MRITWGVCVAMLLLAACKKKEEGQAPPTRGKETDKGGDQAKTPPTTPTPAGSEALVARFNECNGFFTSKEWEKLAGCFTDDAKGIISDANEFVGGKAIAEGLFKPFSDAFPDAKIAPQLILVSGKNLTAVMMFTGTNTGSLMGMPPTNKPAGLYGLRSVTFTEDGTKMSWDLHVPDIATLMAQITESKQPHRGLATAWSPPGGTVIAADSQTERDNVALVMKGCDAFNAHDLKAFGAVMSPDVVMHDMTMPADVVGWSALEKLLTELFGALPDIKGTCTAWGAGDYVVNQVDWTATNTGDMPSMGLKKTGKSLKIHDSELYQVKDGKVTHYWRFSNGMAFAMQLGLVPPPPAAPPTAPAK